jgi:hypothetical protein
MSDDKSLTVANQKNANERKSSQAVRKSLAAAITFMTRSKQQNVKKLLMLPRIATGMSTYLTPGFWPEAHQSYGMPRADFCQVGFLPNGYCMTGATGIVTGVKG